MHFTVAVTITAALWYQLVPQGYLLSNLSKQQHYGRQSQQ